jgi:hypothetical protein
MNDAIAFTVSFGIVGAAVALAVGLYWWRRL